MIEEMKEILASCVSLHSQSLGVGAYRFTASFEDIAQQICQLFPKSPDNPDGYEPKAILDKGMGKIISKPKPDRLLTDEVLAIVVYYLELMKRRPDNDYRNEMVSDIIAKTASIKDNDNILLLQYAEEKYPELLTDANWINIKQSRWSQWQLDKVKESVNVTAIIKDAECQERVERVIKTGDAILEIARHGDYSSGNEFYGQDEGRIKAGILLDEVAAEWQALKEKEGVE